MSINLDNIYRKYNIDISAIHGKIGFTDCPQCENLNYETNCKTLYINKEHGVWHCHHCHWFGDIVKGFANKNYFSNIPKNFIIPNYDWDEHTPSAAIYAWLNKKGITASSVEHFQIGGGERYFKEKVNFSACLVFPYYKILPDGQKVLFNLKYLDTKGNYSFSDFAEVNFWGLESINSDCVIITQTELDRVILQQCGYDNVITLPYYSIDSKDSGVLFDWLENSEKYFTDVKKIILAFHNNSIGKELQEELGRRLGKDRCFKTEILDYTGENEDDRLETFSDVYVSDEDAGRLYVTNIIEDARPFPVEGIHDVIDVSDRIDSLYEFGLKGGVKTGWPNLDAYYTVAEGQLTIVTGVPSHGKSNFLDALLVNVAKLNDWKFGLFSPENQPIERHFSNIIEKYVEAPFMNTPDLKRMTKEQLEKGKRWVNEHFSVILPDPDKGNWSVDGILSLAKTLVFRKGIKGLVVDPWNEIDHARQDKLTETEYISQTLTKLRRFGRMHGVHIWLVAHPAKLYKDKDGRYPVPTPYDIAGSAHFRNKADNCLTVWRNVGGKDEDVSDIHVQKVRFKEIGRPGRIALRYQRIAGCFIDDIDQDKRAESLEKDLETPSKDLVIQRRR